MKTNFLICTELLNFFTFSFPTPSTHPILPFPALFPIYHSTTASSQPTAFVHNLRRVGSVQNTRPCECRTESRCAVCTLVSARMHNRIVGTAYELIDKLCGLGFQRRGQERGGVRRGGRVLVFIEVHGAQMRRLERPRKWRQWLIGGRETGNKRGREG